MNSPTRIVIADDHLLLRQGMRALLESYSDISVVGETGRADDVTPTVVASACDMVLLDLQLDRPVLADVGALATLTKVIVWTASDRQSDAVTAIRLGARAVVHKRLTIDTLVEAIRAVVSGRLWLPSHLLEEAFFASAAANRQTLTSREAEVVQFVAAGLRNAEIADRLGITSGTVKSHLNSIFAKLNVRRRLELALQFRRTADHVGSSDRNGAGTASRAGANGSREMSRENRRL